MEIRQLLDPHSSTYSYLLWDAQTRDAALIDPVLDQAARDIRLVRELGLTLRYTLETDVHADHVTASGLLRRRLNSIVLVHENSGSKCADVLLKDADRIPLGREKIGVLHTPGYSDSAITYCLPASAFTGDTLLVRGRGRTVFRSGDAAALYDSVTRRLFSLADDTIVFPGHDYSGRPYSTIGEEKAFNPWLGNGTRREEFVAFMNRQQADPPFHLYRALASNLRCGLPDDEPALACG
jgi:glyoxylase-like metal-dependent hydrolase (beta-lactamase superfamily II)